MFATATTEHLDMLTENLNGTKAIDENTFYSVAVLAERLDRIKKSNPLFDGVAFSPQLEELAFCETISEIC